MSKKCYIVVEDYEDIKKVFVSKKKAEKFGQDLRDRREMEGEHPRDLSQRVFVREADFDDESEENVLDTLVRHHLGSELELSAGETIDGIDYQYYYHPLTEVNVKCWIDSNGNFCHEDK